MWRESRHSQVSGQAGRSGQGPSGEASTSEGAMPSQVNQGDAHPAEGCRGENGLVWFGFCLGSEISREMYNIYLLKIPSY